MSKTQVQRLNEMLVISKKLQSLGLTKQYVVMEELYTIINNYIKYGESNSGKIPFIEAKKQIHYSFINTLGIESTILLKHYDF